MSDHLSWSVSLDATAATRAFDELVELGRELVHQGFPPSRGYEATALCLQGPLDGVCWRVTRGPFVAELGIQCFTRAHAAGPDATVELRVVASAGQRDADAPDPDVLERRVVVWAMTGWGLGSVALGALLLGASGTLAGWAQALLLVPAAAAWKASISGLVRRAGRPPRALPGDQVRALPSSTQLPSQVEEGLARWRELLPVIRAQRDRLERAGGLPPFREPALLPEPYCEHARALAAGSSLIPFDDASSDRAATPPRRTTRRRGS